MRKWMGMAALAAGLFAAPEAATAGSHAYAVYVDGLACPFCTYGVEKKLLQITGVKKLDIDIDAGAVKVTMAGDARLDEAAARRAVAEAGFTLRRFERTGTR
jgi:mercuric ion binding protein